ncbi:hypothetical protein HDU87_008085 [Geranomyces variabilis]|uniref:Ricin B lectin domain-containing protein n=1 Tax=Geranomyces variabilis TaxID=109894 RepID=A0AAD5TPX9_9FUNG|nr:hypothetical protein HDU87_008085 [Geranomyces variabilis]
MPSKQLLSLAVAAAALQAAVGVSADLVFSYIGAPGSHAELSHPHVILSNLPLAASQCVARNSASQPAPGEICCDIDVNGLSVKSGDQLGGPDPTDGGAIPSVGTWSSTFPGPCGAAAFTPLSASIANPTSTVPWGLVSLTIGSSNTDGSWNEFNLAATNAQLAAYYVGQSSPLAVDMDATVDAGTCTKLSGPSTPTGGGGGGPTATGGFWWDTWVGDQNLGSNNSPWTPTAAQSGGGAPGIVVDVSNKHQQMLGFGFAMTQATAKTFMDTKAASPSQYQALLRAFFDGSTGLGINIIRIAIGPCDFSVGSGAFWDGTALNDHSTGKSSLGQMTMPAEDRQYILPVLQDAAAAGYKFNLYFEAWTFPWWMLSGYENNFGPFNPAMTQVAAQYMVQAAAAWRNAGSWGVFGVGIINEPSMTIDSANWQTSWVGQGGGIGTRLEPGDAAAIAIAMKGMLGGAGLGGAKIVGYAHNWEDPVPYGTSGGYVEQLLGAANGAIDLISWHCYVDAPNSPAIMQKFPNVGHFMGECTATGAPSTGDYFATSGNGIPHIYTTAINAGSGGVVQWNGLLESANSGRRFQGLPNGCATCRGMISSLEATNFQSGCVMPEYFGMRHYAPFLAAGGQRVEMAVNANADCISGNAFVDNVSNPVVVLHNSCAQSITVSVGVAGGTYSHTMQQGSSTLRIANSAAVQVGAHYGGVGGGPTCAASTYKVDCKGTWCGSKLKNRAGHSQDQTGSTGLCIDGGQNGSPGAYMCYGENTNQLLDVVPDKGSDGRWKSIRITFKGQCFGPSGASNGAAVTLSPCQDGLNQVWDYGNDPASGWPYVFKNAANNAFCLDIDSNNMNLQVWSCNGGPSQMWDLYVQGYAYWANDPIGKKSGCGKNGCHIYFRDTVPWPRQKTVDLRNGNTNGEDNWLQGYHPFLESTNQHWDLVPHPSTQDGYAGYYHFGLGGKYGDPYRECISLDQENTNIGALLTVESCNLWKDSQLWQFQANGVRHTGLENADQSGVNYRIQNKATPTLCMYIDHAFYTESGWTSGYFRAQNRECENSGSSTFNVLDVTKANVAPLGCGVFNKNDQCNVMIANAVAPTPNRLCVDIKETANNNGDWVQGWACSAGDQNQRWNIIGDAADPDDSTDDSDKVSYVHIQNARFPQYCLGLWGGDDTHTGNDWGADGSQMVLTYCNLFSAGQKFANVGDGKGGWKLTTKAANKCLDYDAGASKLQQWACSSGSANQVWHFSKGNL